MNYGPRNASILSRLDRHAAHAATAGLRKAAENCFAISQRFADDATEIAQDRRYSAEGKRAKLAEARAQKDALMRDARGPIDTAQKGVEALRAQIKPVVVDQSPVAEMRRAELRTYMRNLPDDPKRMAALLGAFDGRTRIEPDSKIVEAVLDAPAFLSGVSAEHYALAKTTRDERVHATQFREIRALQDVIDEANAAAAVARADLGNVAGDAVVSEMKSAAG